MTNAKETIAEKFAEFLREEGARDRTHDFADDLVSRLEEAGWILMPVAAVQRMTFIATTSHLWSADGHWPDCPGCLMTDALKEPAASGDTR